jgi:Nucleotidyltransferase domain
VTTVAATTSGSRITPRRRERPLSLGDVPVRAASGHPVGAAARHRASRPGPTAAPARTPTAAVVRTDRLRATTHATLPSPDKDGMVSTQIAGSTSHAGFCGRHAGRSMPLRVWNAGHLAGILDTKGTSGPCRRVVSVELSRPLRVVTPTLDGDLLAVLARADVAFTGRQLARLVGASGEGARLALTRLVLQGVVERQAAGAAQMFRLNRDHLAAGPILALASLREELLTRIRAQLAGWDPPPEYAAMFGSTARGEERADSDIDVFVLRPAGVPSDHEGWRSQVTQLERDITRWTGNDTRVLELDLTDVDEAAASGAERAFEAAGSVADDVLRDGIPLAGDPNELRRGRRSLRSAR